MHISLVLQMCIGCRYTFLSNDITHGRHIKKVPFEPCNKKLHQCFERQNYKLKHRNMGQSDLEYVTLYILKSIKHVDYSYSEIPYLILIKL